MIISQAVLEHVDDLDLAYGTMRKWLKPTGYMTHTIDFKSHGMTRDWNGHWAQPELRLDTFARPTSYMLNREPLSTHLNYLKGMGFRVLLELHYTKASPVKRADLSKRFGYISDADFSTSDAFIIAVPDSSPL